MEDGDTLEFTCQMQAYEIEVSEIPDAALSNLTRRLFERNKSHKQDERERLLTEMEDRNLYVPDYPKDSTWYVIELTEEETRSLESSDYPEAYQMSQVPEKYQSEDRGLGARDDDAMRVMLISGWSLMGLDEEFDERADLLSASEYSREMF